MIGKKARHVAFLEYASEGILRFSRSEQFMEWVVQSLFTHLKATHVSIALYDPSRDYFPIRFSSGRSKIPSYLVAFDKESPIVRWFHHRDFPANPMEHLEKPINYRDFAIDIVPSSPAILSEMERYHVEVCAKIETADRLAGYLLIGPQEDGSLYTKDDMVYFQALANDVAIEIQKEEYYQSSHFDPLTGLLNRQSLDMKISSVMQRSREKGTEFAVAVIDVDNFKNINDVYGHLVGDQVLRICAGMIRESIRQTDFAFRYGGEEFLLLLSMSSRDPSRTHIPKDEFHDGIFKVLERIREKIAERPIQYLNHSIPLSVSLGVAFYDGDVTKTKDELIDRADKALYESKNTGKNRTTIFTNALKEN